MARIASWSCAVLAFLTLAACGDSTGITAEQIACPTPQTLTYANFGQQVITDYCLECHATRERPHLTSQAEIQAAADEIITEAVFHSSMPEDASMTDELRIQLGQWLQCGAP